MHPMFRVLALSLALGGPLAHAEPAGLSSSGSLTISTTTEKVAGTSTFPTIANDSAITMSVPAILCRDPAGRMVTPTAKGCASVDAQPMALDDPDLSPAYFGKSLGGQTSHQSLLADLAKYKGDQVVLYLSSGRSLSGTLTDADLGQVGFRDSAGRRYHVDPGRIVAFGESGE